MVLEGASHDRKLEKLYPSWRKKMLRKGSKNVEVFSFIIIMTDQLCLILRRMVVVVVVVMVMMMMISD
jgi:hypothetical protein